MKYIKTFESFINEASDKKYKKGDVVQYRMHIPASGMVATSKAEKSKDVKVDRIVKTTKKLGQNVYVLKSGIEISDSEIIGLDESHVNEARQVPAIIKAVNNYNNKVNKSTSKKKVDQYLDDLARTIIDNVASNGPAHFDTTEGNVESVIDVLTREYIDPSNKIQYDDEICWAGTYMLESNNVAGEILEKKHQIEAGDEFKAKTDNTIEDYNGAKDYEIERGDIVSIDDYKKGADYATVIIYTKDGGATRPFKAAIEDLEDLIEFKELVLEYYLDEEESIDEGADMDKYFIVRNGFTFTTVDGKKYTIPRKAEIEVTGFSSRDKTTHFKVIKGKLDGYPSLPKGKEFEVSDKDFSDYEKDGDIELNESLNEAKHIDIMYALKTIKSWNKGGNNEFEDLAEDIIKHLGYKPDKNSIEKVSDHLAASTDKNDKVPEDKDLIEEIYTLLEQR